MIRRIAPKLFLATAVLALSAASQAQDFTIEPSPALSSLNVPSTLADLLDQGGSRLVRNTNRGKSPIADVWLVKTVPAAKAVDSSPDVLFNNIQVGTLVGLLQFLSPDAEDARDQKLKPGLYTMRYAQIPQDGNHMGVSQYRDFLLLSPLSADTQVDKVLSFDDLVTLSRKAAGTGHPAVMSLVSPNPAYKKLPAVVADDQGNCSIQVNLHEKSAAGAQEAKLALMLVTAPKEEGGS
ncbi:MAG TPA: hypothetical protein VI455_03890 [Terriglobia bacterium]